MIATIVLAAGEARRMGKPKQLMQLQGQSLVQRAVQVAQRVSPEVIVVTGAYPKEIQEDLRAMSASLVHNADWASGMGSSIRCGIQHAMHLPPALSAVIILLCDQPFVNVQLLQQLLQLYRQSGNPLIASAYQNTVGVPALFDASLFPALLALDNKTGAKQIMTQYASQMAIVDFPEGAYDIDTPEDFIRIQKKLSDL